jgi:hypothetical protein
MLLLLIAFFSWRDAAAPPISYPPHVVAVHHWAVSRAHLFTWFHSMMPVRFATAGQTEAGLWTEGRFARLTGAATRTLHPLRAYTACAAIFVEVRMIHLAGPSLLLPTNSAGRAQTEHSAMRQLLRMCPPLFCLPRSRRSRHRAESTSSSRLG